MDSGRGKRVAEWRELLNGGQPEACTRTLQSHTLPGGGMQQQNHILQRDKDTRAGLVKRPIVLEYSFKNPVSQAHFITLCGTSVPASIISPVFRTLPGPPGSPGRNASMISITSARHTGTLPYNIPMIVTGSVSRQKKQPRPLFCHHLLDFQ